MSRRYRLEKHDNFISEGRVHYNIKRLWTIGWISINDDYGYTTLEEAEAVLESLRYPPKRSVTSIVKEVEYE